MIMCVMSSFEDLANKMRVFTLFTFVAVGLASVAAVPSGRVVGGTETTIITYPFSAALLYTRDFFNYQQECGGTIINNRSVMTAAHCVMGDAPIRWQIRVGSVFANFGGAVMNTIMITIHPNYNVRTLDSDIAIVRSATTFVFSTSLRAASIAGANFNILDNALVWAIGWGATSYDGPRSETLRHVQIWVVNQATCISRYAELGLTVTDNMLCAGWLDVGGRDQCIGDSGSPLVHNNVIVGIRSWGQRCGLPRYPGVSTRIPRFTAWITANA
ncbi:trypsin CFT-1-like [Epargyreus clarus]|uniref:trypsin CFT-1-like n=1 Tax=Epargyreus clarus TaxID=520877 RepID=UPI003C2E7802